MSEVPAIENKNNLPENLEVVLRQAILESRGNMSFRSFPQDSDEKDGGEKVEKAA